MKGQRTAAGLANPSIKGAAYPASGTEKILSRHLTIQNKPHIMINKSAKPMSKGK